MFHKVTMVVYFLFGAMAGHKVSQWADVSTGTMFVYVVAGIATSMLVYALLRFLRFAESAYRREMAVAPTIFKSGDNKDMPRPEFTSK